MKTFITSFLSLISITLNSLSQDVSWLQKLRDKEKIESSDLEKIISRPSLQDENMLRLVFANGNQDTKFKGVEIFSRLKPTRQREILSIILAIDEVWVPASMVRNHAYVSSIAESGGPPVIYGGTEGVIDLTTLCKTVSRTLSELKIENIDPSMLFGRKAREGILKKLNTEQGSVPIHEDALAVLVENGVKSHQIKPVQSTLATALPVVPLAFWGWMLAAAFLAIGVSLFVLTKRKTKK
ncbi:MAG: hypothetical protein NTY98_03810 [Verrucomicrobia bacterium]|nr:hypothetical protein [Verrucomicrobiota bacterium]